MDYDFVEKPSHYNGHSVETKEGKFTYETIDLINSEIDRLSKHGVPAKVCFQIGQAIKYLNRLGEKPEAGKTTSEKTLEDLEKANWYLKEAIELSKNNKPVEALAEKQKRGSKENFA